MHIFLSPHYDDAVFSCGATIHRLTAGGDAVTVLTVMGGVPEKERLPDTPFIRELHTRWNAGDDPVRARITEDEAAVTSLGAAAQHLSVWLDCVYRVSRSDGKALYPDVTAIFGAIPADDPAALLPMVILPQAAAAQVIYAPLGVGHHVDHVLVRDWALELRNQNPGIALKFYEEYPYMQESTAVEQARQFFAERQPPLPLVAERTPVEEADFAAKVQAMAHYQTQLSSFWDSPTTMESVTRKAMRDAATNQFVERYWGIMN